MDVQLTQSSVLTLPSSQRVDAIVHDGTADLRPWPRPGPDRELLEHYGPELNRVLARERERLPGGELPLGGQLRLHRGKLHCDFLLWIATRPRDQGGVRAPAPNAATLTNAVNDALVFCSERHVSRVAFGPLGEGVDAVADIERLILVANAANAYSDACYAASKPAGIEEVLVCDASSSRIQAARRTLGRTVSVVSVQTRVAPTSPDKTTRRRGARSSTRTSSSKKTTTKRASVRLSDDEVGRARAGAGPYNRANTYAVGDYFVHAKFGVGRVDEITREGFIMVLFQNGDTKRLLHARP